MKKTLVAAAFALTLSVGSIAVQSPASANPAWLDPALAGSGADALITTVAHRTASHAQPTVAPQPQEPQDYPKYHDQQTASYMSPQKSNPCHFTQARVEGKMRQVEVCD